VKRPYNQRVLLLLYNGRSAERWRTVLVDPRTTALGCHFIPRKTAPPPIRPFSCSFMDADEKKPMHACRPI